MLKFRNSVVGYKSPSLTTYYAAKIVKYAGCYQLGLLSGMAVVVSENYCSLKPGLRPTTSLS